MRRRCRVALKPRRGEGRRVPRVIAACLMAESHQTATVTLHRAGKLRFNDRCGLIFARGVTQTSARRGDQERAVPAPELGATEAGTALKRSLGANSVARSIRLAASGGNNATSFDIARIKKILCRRRATDEPSALFLTLEQ